MSAEPENNIDEQLKAYADKRREAAGGPFELHPANRRLLQAEVAETYAQKEAAAPASEPRRAAWTALLPRLAWAGGLLSLIVLGTVILNRPQERQLAMTARESEMSAPSSGYVTLEAADAAPKHDKDFGNTANATSDFVLPAAPESAPATEWLEADRFGGMAPEKKLAEVPRELAELQARSRQTVGELKQRQEIELEAMREEKAAKASESLALAKKPLADAPPALPPVQTAPPPPPPSPTRRALYSDAVTTAPARPADAAEPAVPSGAVSGSRVTNLAVSRDGLASTGKDMPVARTEQLGALRMERAKTEVAAADGEPASRALSLQSELTPAPAAVPGSNRSGVGGGGFQSGQAFVQAVPQDRLRRNFNSPPRADVLNNFHLQQMGNQLTVVDGDGSVYTGEILLVEDESGAMQKAKESRLYYRSAEDFDTKEARTARSSRGLVPQNGLVGQASAASGAQQLFDANELGANVVFFHVSGTNRSLHRVVEFTGQIQQVTNAPANTVAGEKSQIGKYDAYIGASSQAPALRVQGNAIIGNSRIPVDAVPVPVQK